MDCEKMWGNMDIFERVFLCAQAFIDQSKALKDWKEIEKYEADNIKSACEKLEFYSEMFKAMKDKM